MDFIETASRRFGIAGEILSFFASHKRWWMMQVVTVVLLTGILIILAQSSALASFIYTLF